MLEQLKIRKASQHALGFSAWRVAGFALVVAGFALVVAGIALVATGASAQVRVTSLEGDLTADGQSVSIHSRLAANQQVAVSEASRGAFLIADDKLVQLCNGARASFTGVEGRGIARVDLDQGQLSATVLATPGESALEIDTPSARIEVLGSAVHVAVSPGGTTTVSSLQGTMRVSKAGGSGRSVLINTNESISVRQNQSPGKKDSFDQAVLARSSDCLRSETHRASAVAASSFGLLHRSPDVSAGGEAAFPSHLAQIVAADFPTDGLLEDASSSSALIQELNKAGLNEEVCDPITCNPVFALPAPERCGPIPITGCIP